MSIHIYGLGTEIGNELALVCTLRSRRSAAWSLSSWNELESVLVNMDLLSGCDANHANVVAVEQNLRQLCRSTSIVAARWD